MAFRIEKNGRETWIVADNGTHVATMNTSLGPEATVKYATILASTATVVRAALSITSPVPPDDGADDGMRAMGFQPVDEDNSDGIPDDTT